MMEKLKQKELMLLGNKKESELKTTKPDLVSVKPEKTLNLNKILVFFSFLKQKYRKFG